MPAPPVICKGQPTRWVTRCKCAVSTGSIRPRSTATRELITIWVTATMRSEPVAADSVDLPAASVVTRAVEYSDVELRSAEDGVLSHERGHTSTVCPIVVFQPLDSDDKLSQQWAEPGPASLPGRRRLRNCVNELPLAVCVDLKVVPWHRPAIVDINKRLYVTRRRYVRFEKLGSPGSRRVLRQHPADSRCKCGP